MIEQNELYNLLQFFPLFRFITKISPESIINVKLPDTETALCKLVTRGEDIEHVEI